MRYDNPVRLSLFMALILLLVFSFVFITISLFIEDHFHWVFFLVLSPVLFIVSYFFIKYALEKFIYEKIKLIFKTIHTQKLSREDKLGKRSHLKGDIIGNVNKEVEDWITDKHEEIEQLKNLETYRKEFLANVSHELKTPIFNIQGYVLTLLEGGLEDPAINHSYLEKTEKNVERMIHMVEELEIITRLETGEAKVEAVRFDILLLVREIFDLLDKKASEKKILFLFGSDYQYPVNVNADREKIRQVLTNLIDNSVKYGREGGRTKLSFYDMDENVLVEVSDNGIGIEEQHLPRLFERFYRADKHRSRSLGGSGLGLAIVKHIIEAHEQTVNVRSTPGIGSTFSFTLKKG
jgi:two-component system, OmpR family, phosphate regulon sensor histidine kinase PhoR